MQAEQLIITVYAVDRPGIVKALSDAVIAHQGSWLESSLSRLCGQFAGIVHISVPTESQSDLLAAFKGLANDGIDITVQSVVAPVTSRVYAESLEIVVEANDRPGIVGEVASALADADVNVEQMETEVESASMAGYELFRAHLVVALPESCSIEELETALESVSDDLMVSIIAQN